ncbi:hypothetical protein C8R46DRAFT_113868 [Mycena filopes]|nr:hypothetical protein C8R46DRAFT_113868 [Mycena filopes]
MTTRHIAPRPSEPSSSSFQTRRAAAHPTSIPPSEPLSKPRSRRCFVCGTTGRHPLDFRVCPRTAVLLRRSLARVNDDGRLVLFDHAPLPMTRHPGGVAGHLLSRSHQPLRAVLEQSQSPPRVVHIPHRLPSERDKARSLTFNPTTPHTVPRDRVAPVPEHVPPRRDAPSCPHAPRCASESSCRARASLLVVLLESLLNSVFRRQLSAIIVALDGLSGLEPAVLRRLIQPVFTRISHFPT